MQKLRNNNNSSINDIQVVNPITFNNNYLFRLADFLAGLKFYASLLLNKEADAKITYENKAAPTFRAEQLIINWKRSKIMCSLINIHIRM